MTRLVSWCFGPSQPERKVTRDLYNLNLLVKLMAFLRQIMFNLAIAAIAEAILTRISAEQVPSLHRVAPMYLKLVTSSTGQQFMLISAVKLLTLLAMILLFSVLTSIAYAVAQSTSLW